MLKTRELMSAKSELSKEHQVSCLLIHEKVVCKEAIVIKAIFSLACNL